MSQSAVSRIWRAFGLQPHRRESWKLSRDPQFIAKVTRWKPAQNAFAITFSDRFPAAETY